MTPNSESLALPAILVPAEPLRLLAVPVTLEPAEP
jgi:hypothetical protein